MSSEREMYADFHQDLMTILEKYLPPGTPRTLAGIDRALAELVVPRHPTLPGRLTPIKPPDNVISEAVRVARQSPCAKSKRGVAVFKWIGPAPGSVTDAVIIGVGGNGPPHRPNSPGQCDGSNSCKVSCSKTCMHAEERAILRAQLSETDAHDYDLVHVKVESDEGNPVAGGGPSCWQCSRTILDRGFAGIWLYEKSERQFKHVGPVRAEWHYYTAQEFHDATLKACGLHPYESIPPGTSKDIAGNITPLVSTARVDPTGRPSMMHDERFGDDWPVAGAMWESAGGTAREYNCSLHGYFRAIGNGCPACELQRMRPVYEIARRWCLRPESVISKGREPFVNDVELWHELRRRVEAAERAK